jgi:hypothetical protein
LLSVKITTVVLIFIGTLIVAKIECWHSKKSIFGLSFAPTSIFIAWAIAQYLPIPIISPFLKIFGNNVFLIIGLSFLYKMIYDAVMDC